MNIYGEKVSSELRDKGVITCKSFLTKKEIKTIQNEIEPYIKSISKISNYSNRILRKTKNVLEISDLAAVSESAMKYILNEKLANIASDYFGEKVRVGEFKYLKQLNATYRSNLYAHCDGSRSVLTLIYLSGATSKNGPTYFFENSHNLRNKIKKLRISKNQYQKYKSFINFYVADNMKPGDLVIYDVRTWHGRIIPQIKGREAIWVEFFPESNKENTLDMLLKSSSISSLSPFQKSLLGLDDSHPRRKNLEIQYFNSPKNGLFEGVIGNFLNIIHNKIANINNYILDYFLSLKIFLKIKFVDERNQNRIESYFAKKPSGKDINSDQML